MPILVVLILTGILDMHMYDDLAVAFIAIRCYMNYPPCITWIPLTSGTSSKNDDEEDEEEEEEEEEVNVTKEDDPYV